MLQQPPSDRDENLSQVVLRTDKTLQQQPIQIVHRAWYIKLLSLLADGFDECLGTLYLIFFVAGIQVVDQYSTNIGLGALEITAVTKGVTSAFALIAIIMAFGKRSGGHFNPVVTLACLLRGHCSIVRALWYWATQFGGACAGAAILKSIFGNIAFLGTTIPTGSNGKSVGMEIMLTFIFLVVILTVSEREGHKEETGQKWLSLSRVSEESRSLIAATIIGFTFGCVQTFGWNISGASVNPYRSLGPALVNGSSTALKPIWVYFVGPICGSILAVIYRWMLTGLDFTFLKFSKTITTTSPPPQHHWYDFIHHGKNNEVPTTVASYP